ncbi:MAG: UDP-N-acetylmuramate--L-alanine ligase [Flavobacteriales bacterium]
MTKQHIHLIAIGGSAMHNLALELKALGHEVTGSDDQIFEPSRSRLNAQGLLPKTMGWSASRIHSGLDVVILGMHAKPDNPELLAAQTLGLTIQSYPEFIYSTCQNKTRVVIGGSHGKTTTTSMILHCIEQCSGLQNVDYMVGAQLKNFDRMVSLSSEAQLIVIEGDEYLSSPIDRRSKFLWYKPQIAVLTGIAWDHINVFPTFDSYLETFKAFVLSIEPGGVLFYNQDDVVLSDLVNSIEHDIQKVAYTTAKHHIKNGQTFLEFQHQALAIKFFGAHNLMNFQAANLVLQALGYQEEKIVKSIQNFEGADKRLSLIHQSEHRLVYRDFAHSPSKVKACVEAVKTQFKDADLHVVLELHTYSSLSKSFLPNYKSCFDGIPSPILFYSPKALEIKQMEALDADYIRQAFQCDDLAIYSQKEDLEQALKHRKSNQTKPSVFLFMSSGQFAGLDLLSFN